MKKHLSTIILLLILVVGLGLLAYPSFSNWWNNNMATRMIASYTKSVTEIDDSEFEALLTAAREYNEELKNRGSYFLDLDEEEKEVYNSVLDVTGTGIMGYIEIPSIKCTLPIYHSTDDAVLQIAIGHLDFSHLPVGGEGTHTALSGHRGLPSARLFTDIDRLVIGDQFYLNMLGETLTYEVDQINIVLPDEMDSLRPVEGQDLCTLITCTPYGINSHRLLVRGHRVDTTAQGYVRVTADAIQIRPVQVAPFVAAPILLILLILLFTTPSQVDDYDDDNPKGGVFRA